LSGGGGGQPLQRGVLRGVVCVVVLPEALDDAVTRRGRGSGWRVGDLRRGRGRKCRRPRGDLLRIGGSLKQGYVSAALLIARLQAGTRQHPLAKAMLEYGKLLRTLHAMRWFTDEAFRRRIGRQLNRGEALNDLRRCIFFANRGAVRHPHHDDQSTQAHCHTLVVNACVLSTTGYLQDAIDAQRADGHPVSADAIAHLSPAQFETINPYGTLTFDIAGVLERPRRALLRP
jgi:Tn3 transposase DDE domain